jgi:nucleotide-binding universal stress UspA family protein
MKKILFPTDFSEVSKNAFIYALKLAEAIHADIITLHVYQMLQPKFVDFSAYLNEVYEVTELSNFENYRDEVPVLRVIAEENNLGHIKVSHVLVMGNLIDEIEKITEDESIDFVVMGTKGATGLKETFLGTVTTKIMDDVKAIVFAIPSHCQYQPIKRILFVTQFKPNDFNAFKKVMQLAHLLNAHIDCLYVQQHEHEGKNDFTDNWKTIVEKRDIVLHTIKSNDVEGVILSFIELHKINTIAMLVYHRNFFEKLFQISLSKKLAFHVDIPILAIHE